MAVCRGRVAVAEWPVPVAAAVAVDRTSARDRAAAPVVVQMSVRGQAAAIGQRMGIYRRPAVAPVPVPEVVQAAAVQEDQETSQGADGPAEILARVVAALAAI